MKKDESSKNNWLLHYNPYNKTYNAFKREDLQGYFNGDKKTQKRVYTSKRLCNIYKKIK